MFCRDKDFVPASGSPGEIRGSTTSIPEIAVRFHAGKVRLALFIYYFFFYSDCIFFFFAEDRGFGETEMQQWFNSDIGLGNKWRLRKQLSLNQILGLFLWEGRSLTWSGCQLSLECGFFHCGGVLGGTGAGPNQSVDLPELYLVLHSGCHFGNSMNLSGL